MPLAEKLPSQIHKRFHPGGQGGSDPLPETDLGGLAGIGPIEFKELFFEQHRPIDTVIEFGQLVENLTLPFGGSALHQNEPFPTMKQIGQLRVLPLSGLPEFFLANRVQSVIQRTLDMEVIENDQGVLVV